MNIWGGLTVVSAATRSFVGNTTLPLPDSFRFLSDLPLVIGLHWFGPGTGVAFSLTSTVDIVHAYDRHLIATDLRVVASYWVGGKHSVNVQLLDGIKIYCHAHDYVLAPITKAVLWIQERK